MPTNQDAFKARLEKAKERIDEQLEKLASGTVTESELERAELALEAEPMFNIACDTSCNPD